MSYVIAETLTSAGMPPPRVIWLPGAWARMMRGEAIDMMAVEVIDYAPSVEDRDG